MRGLGAPADRPEDDYRPALDGLRAIAVTAVILFHVDRLPGGNLGVDAFFVLSGWLITTRLLAQADRSAVGRIDLPAFWSARLRRLLPASLALILVVVLVWTATGIVVPSLRHDAIWAIGWSSNWGTITGGGDYWARFGEPSPLTHLWSLAVEEQLYLMWPLVLWAICGSRVPRRGVAVSSVSIALAGASVAWMVRTFDAAAPTATYVDTFARAHSLLIGAALAGVTSTQRGRRLVSRHARFAMGPAACLVMGIVMVASADSRWLYAWGFPLFAIAMGVVVVAAAEGAGATVLASPPLRWLGDRSYGVYLWHWPVILLLSPRRVPLPAVQLDAVRVLVSVGLAAASFAWLEMPIRSRRPLAAWRTPATAAGALAIAFGAVIWLDAPHPPQPQVASTVALTAPTSASSPVARAAKPGPAWSERRSVEEPAGVIDGAVPVANVEPARPVRVLVAGDSTAVHLAKPLLAYAQVHPDSIVAGSAAFPGCGLTASTDGRLHALQNPDGSVELVDLNGCTRQWRTIIDRIPREHIDVVLVDIGAWDGSDIHLPDGRVVSLADQDGVAVVMTAYRAFVTGVEEAGARVVWVTPPNLQLQWGAIDTPLNDPRRWISMRAVIDALPVEQIDLNSWLTANGLEGPDARPDGVHLSDPVNVRFVEEVVVAALTQAA